MRRILFSFITLVIGLFWLSMVGAADTHQGKVVESTATTLTMTDMTGKNQHTHTVPSDAAVHRDGKTVPLTALQAGDTVSITMGKKGDAPTVTQVEAQLGK